MKLLNFLGKLTLLVSLGTAPAFGARTVIDCSRLLLKTNEQLPTTRQELIQSISNTVEPDKYAVSEYGQLQGRWILYRLRAISPNYDVLVADIGLIAHFDEFVDFMGSLRTIPNDPWHARQKFAEYLGMTTVFRAITIQSRDEIIGIREFGLDSSFEFNSKDENNKQKIQILSNELGDGLVTNLHRRFGRVKDGRLRYNLFHSVSQYPDIALGISSSHYGDLEKPFIALFEIHIPTIDLIEPGRNGHIEFPWFVRYGAKVLKLHSMITFKSGEKNSYPFDYRVESMVFYRIEPSEIRKIYVLSRNDEQLPEWEGSLFGKSTIAVSREEALSRLAAKVLTVPK